MIFTYKYFLFTEGSVCRVKQFTIGGEKRGKRFADDEEVEMELRKWLRQNLNLCCGFRRTDKEVGQVYQCWWRICQVINVFFSGSNITC
jgi:hypothetical protein